MKAQELTHKTHKNESTRADSQTTQKKCKTKHN